MSKQPRPTSPQPQKPQKGPTESRKSEGIQTGPMTPRISNRRATFDYEVLDKIECGIELLGSEVKSVRKGHVQMAQSFARIKNGQVLLFGIHIEEYTEANRYNHDPTRNRKLLLHRREIRRLEQRLQKEDGATLIPLEIYFRRGYAKVLLAIAKGKRQFDKRQSIKAREDKRNMEKALRRR